MPQDVKLSPDGRTFYVADMAGGGVWLIDARTLQLSGFIRTGAGAHGLYPSRDARLLYVTNRAAGTVSVAELRARTGSSATWRIPHGTPDMGGVSADGRTLWLSGRYDAEVYAIDTRTGRLLRPDPRRRRAARPVRVAAARPLLARPHRGAALTCPQGWLLPRREGSPGGGPSRRGGTCEPARRRAPWP